MTQIVKMKGMNKHFGKLHVLKDIDLTVEQGEVVVIIGASGSGKATSPQASANKMKSTGVSPRPPSDSGMSMLFRPRSCACCMNTLSTPDPFCHRARIESAVTSARNMLLMASWKSSWS